MIKKKITMVGAFAVGKTSLVQRFVNSIYSEKYQTTIGVKIDQKNLVIDGKEVTLLLWDIHGEDDFMKVKPTYLIGSSGYFIVVDGTRYETMQTALQLQEMASAVTKEVPFIVLINKSDLRQEWEINNDDIELIRKRGWQVILTSARDNIAVEEAFEQLTRMMLNQQ